AIAGGINRVLHSVVDQIVRREIRDSIPEEEERNRIETLVGVFEGTFRFVLWVVALLMVLPEMGVETAPILASLGVAGLAVGMAAREIIADFVTGIFIILENQYHLGDFVKVAGVEGTVKEITLRRTIVEDQDGQMHSIPNSKISIVTKKNQ
ncbi:MAG: mechanosensitive ion channel, partial [Candidatus Nealsonbacteria bacterium]|nr:mechanosensitive ion channel [Candidatus Nealsonbacteria bacterium]